MIAKSNSKTWSPALIKLLRGKRTQEEFARLLSAPKNTVWRWESGLATPAAAYAKKLGELAEKERFLADWQPVGSITWVGDLEAGAKEIALDFSRVFARSVARRAPKSKSRS
jgi:transcriptional regulator with XRE-family HTH domain